MNTNPWLNFDKQHPTDPVKERTQEETDLKAFDAFADKHGLKDSSAGIWLAALRWERDKLNAGEPRRRQQIAEEETAAHSAVLDVLREEIVTLKAERDSCRRAKGFAVDHGHSSDLFCHIVKERDEARAEASKLRRSIKAGCWYSLHVINCETPPAWHTP